MTKYEQILKAVQAACDLSVARACDGCQGSGDEWTFGSQFHKPWEKCLDCDGKGYFGYNEPVRLSHVLRAVRARKGDTYFGVMDDGKLIAAQYRDEKGNTASYIHADWNLEKDDLSLQSEETINLLFDILCK